MSRTLLSLGRARVDEPGAVLDLAAVVTNQAKLLPRLLGSRIAVDCVAPRPVAVRATPAGLEQIVLNLAVNARDAMPSGGTLVLSVREEGDRARLDVRDTGMGMPESVRAKMFEPFFTTRATGTGLGLATVKELVNRFEGTVSVESEVGQGSCFTIHLPLSPTPAEPATPPLQASHSVRRRRVLLVEDNELVRRDLTKLMLIAGLDVTAVCDGDEALALLDGARGFDAVVSDLSMPRVGGDVMANAMRSRGLRLPIIFFSGNAAPQTMPENTSFLAKPVSMATLAAELERVCLPR
jgi:two-component system cell cycle sensor histidine kinase/response regulator CckA